MDKTDGILRNVKKEDLILLENNPKKFWKGVDTIGEYCFDDCKNLQEIEIPSSIKLIKKYAFAGLSLRKIKLNEGLERIEKLAFDSCIYLDEIEIPSTVKKIPYYCFWSSKLKKIILNEGLEELEPGAFYGSKELKEIILPSTTHKIGDNAFTYSDVELVKLSDNIKVIGNSAFENCKYLHEIEIPSLVKELSLSLFNASGLRHIKLNEGLERIGRSCFANCALLRKVYLPSTVKTIGECAFKNSNIIDVRLNEGLEKIEAEAFSFCNSLESIRLPSSIKVIGKKAFASSDLKEIEFNEGLEEIDIGAFQSCRNLEIIKLPSSVIRVNNEAFTWCNNIKEIHIPYYTILDDFSFPDKKDYERIYFYSIESIATCKWIMPFLNDINSTNGNDISIIYYNEKTKEFLIQNSKITDVPEGFEKYNKIDEYVKRLECKKSLAFTLINSKYNLDLLKEKHFTPKNNLINYMLEDGTLSMIDKIYNGKEFSSMMRRIANNYNGVEIYDIFKLAFNLGAFESDNITRQKACNFIENLFDKNVLNYENIHEIFSHMCIDGYNEEWAEFFMNKNNTKQIINKELNHPGFIAKTYNDFDKLKVFCTSNKGSQRQLKVTVEACIQYFINNSFLHVDETNRDVAEVLSSYTNSQISFDNARKIRQKYLQMRERGEIKDHLLDEELKDEVFDRISEMRIQIVELVKETICNLVEVPTNKFTYEFLSKYDPRNFVLGKFCSCCAHVEGLGYGIMGASILHPDCQNLVIKNSTGKIIGKAILYINREMGYGVFNTIELSNSLQDKDRKCVYDKFKNAIVDFVNKYNEINKDNPLKQINVGMHSNKLGDIIRMYDEEGEILEGFNFASYGLENQNYAGDWYDEQYIMWKSK